MGNIKATEIFTPGAYPLRTYVERQDQGLEKRLRDGLETVGQVISLAGPSKSGKTVLVERVVGKKHLITITGAGISDAAEVWDKILDGIDVPDERSASEATERKATFGGEIGGKAGVPFFAQGELKSRFGIGSGRGSEKVKVYHRRGMKQVIEELAQTHYVVLIDDFHYMPRDVQIEVAKQIKEAVRSGVKIVTASVAHRSDDVVRANPELRGRVQAINLDYWESHELCRIPAMGFSLLNAALSESTMVAYAAEAAGSPQLMQSICLQTCFELDLRYGQDKFTEYTLGQPERGSIFERTAATADFRSLVDVLDDGPKTRGTERKMYHFTDLTEGDVYRCTLKAVAMDPPQLSFPYAAIITRVSKLCKGDNPVGSSVTGCCNAMAKLAAEKFPSERVIDWDEQKQVLDIPDPYLLFYLRWSKRLMEPEIS